MQIRARGCGWQRIDHIECPAEVSLEGVCAKRLGFEDPRAALDIGAAIGANPIAIVVPCHRVIASNGDLKGYAWGLHRKRWLLEHENAFPRAASTQHTPRLPGF